jgi:hypothetical protein
MPEEKPETLFFFDGHALVYRADDAMLRETVHTAEGERAAAIRGSSKDIGTSS